MGKKYIGYAGTYTRKSSQGIYRFVLDTEKATLDEVEVAAEVGSPTYLAISEDNRYLYSVAQDGDFGGVNVYALDRETGSLQYINGQFTEGAPPCHVTIRDKELLTANYHRGTIELHQVNQDGTVEATSSNYQHEGSGPHKRQEKPHVHYAGHTPDGKYVIAADLGTDELVTYQMNQHELVRVSTLTVKAGSGPRHIVFHPNGKIAYLITELSSEVIVLNYNAETGSFLEKQCLSTIPEDFTEKNDASAIHISSDGKFIYAGNRGHNSIAVFSIDEETGELTLIDHTTTGGDWPRDFVLDPSENFIIASNQHSGNLVLLARDAETGKLSKLNAEVSVPEVVCVKFLNH
ncbi:MAG TPA: lactonase family protein [Virgibacillus sp.]|nr:lactonase family protein [Virgibacillus sp.]HLR67627.1 lactonase family protein [Virgibacillus sp.]